MEELKNKITFWMSQRRGKIDIPLNFYKLENGYLFSGTYYKTLEEASEDFLKQLKDYFER